MKTLTVDGASIIVLKERGHGDGGMMLNYLVQESDGTFSGIRHWFSDPLVAEAEYQATTEAAARVQIDLARKQARGERLNQNTAPTARAKK